MQYMYSVYDADGNCKVCKANIVGLHKDGCEVDALRKALEAAQQSVHTDQKGQNLNHQQDTGDASAIWFCKLCNEQCGINEHECWNCHHSRPADTIIYDLIPRSGSSSG